MDRLLRFPAKIGGRAALGHPIYFGHERSIGGSNSVLPDIDLVFAEAGLVLPKAKASVPAFDSYDLAHQWLYGRLLAGMARVAFGESRSAFLRLAGP
jgi:hypothetical protein